jgi:hypothetical protein
VIVNLSGELARGMPSLGQGTAYLIHLLNNDRNDVGFAGVIAVLKDDDQPESIFAGGKGAGNQSFQ